MKKTFIVLLDLDMFVDARRVCESIEDFTFKLDNITSTNIAKKVKHEMGIEENHEGVYVYPITDFMDDYNDEHINEAGTFMTYVHGVHKEE